ncbi:hypothetical protein HDF24_22950 [Mucilaginibacter sp. X4EP1]|uniref:hypothetical protein n=1 Tax=Mucilaginibacter sp. X4EP1 TaxID=2723092 RepID=UPI002169F1DC|nr:hypothetical protein [Mucilaginibacter sp. X4EP1]MCS3815992.1 hypothetical protein [Mucilaginibacter sp. X4EP1]
MRKTVLLVIISVATALGAYAQQRTTLPQFSIGFNPGVAIGPVSSVYPVAGELSLRLVYPLSTSPVSLIFTTGYTFYTSSAYSVGADFGGFGVGYGGYSDSYYGSTASFIPVMAGVKIYVAHSVFIEGDAGASFNVNTYPGDYTGRTTAFIYSPGAGYTIPLGRRGRNSADFGLFYENRVEPGGGYTQIAAHVAYNFGL